jgi:hypothetical protein
MTASRKHRLERVRRLQEKLKRLHETRHAIHLSDAVAAEQEATEIRERIGAEGSLSEVFPEVYHRRAARANQRRLEGLARARDEADRVAKANARTDIAERNYEKARRDDERQRGEKDQLEEIERRTRSR